MKEPIIKHSYFFQDFADVFIRLKVLIDMSRWSFYRKSPVFISPMFRYGCFILLVLSITVPEADAITMTTGTSSAVITNQAPHIMVNGRVSEGVHSEIQVRTVRHKDRLMAILFNHGTSPMQSSRNRIDTGHPGFAMDMIKAALSGVKAMYVTASGGNQFPKYFFEIRNWLRMLIRYYEEDLPLATEMIDMICTDDTYLNYKKNTELQQKYEYAIDDRFPVYEEVIVATIGAMPMVAMQGEVVAHISARIKDSFRPDGPVMVNNVITLVKDALEERV